jgi:hypothetical protein
LLLSCLHAMKAERYAYAVIGWRRAGFYAAVGAVSIEDPSRAIIRPLLLGCQECSDIW